MAARLNSVVNDFSALTRAAFQGNSRDAVQRLLQRVAKMMGCYGCVLWQATDDANPWGVKPTGALFMLGTWFPNKATFGIHNLRFDRSLAGEAIIGRRMKIYPNILKTDAEHAGHAFLKIHRLTQSLVAPLEYQETGPGNIGAISLYRQTGAQPFDQESEVHLSQILSILPTLIEVIRKGARLALFERVSAAFQTPNREDLRAEQQQHRMKPFQAALNKAAAAIAQTFHTSETMILLRDVPTDSVGFRSYAVSAHSFLKKKLGKRIHPADASEESFTSLCLASRLPVRVLNLSDPSGDVEWWNRNGFPEFRWRKAKEVERDARMVLGIKPRGALPPLSFLAVPILSGDELIGAIRCWVARPGLAYFSKSDQKLLEALASQVAQAWKSHEREASMAEEAAAWRAAAKEFDPRAEQLYQKIGSDMPESRESAAAIAALHLTDRIFSSSLINDIRLIDETKQELFSAYIPRRPQKHQLSAKEWRKRFDQALSLSRDANERAVQAVASREVIFADVGDGYVSRFPEITTALMAPILNGDLCLGVLVIRSNKPFPTYAKTMAELIGARLGSQIAGFRSAAQSAASADAERLARESLTQAFQDINHQMRGPMFQAILRLDSMLGELEDTSLKAQVRRIRSLMVRARRTSRSVAVFAELERGNSLQSNPKSLPPEKIRSLVEEGIEDAFVDVDPERKLNPRVDVASFQILSHDLQLDEELLHHALGNLLDNAVKYSYPITDITVRMIRGRRGRLYLSVTNIGFPISRTEIKHLTIRGYRGRLAQHSAGEGSGIGLWITDRIMHAMGGSLEIEPTDPNGKNDFRLYLPESL
jgi:signal transduction histidine kinase